MRYFEVENPYYGLISAKDEKQAKEIYSDWFLDDEEEVKITKELNRDEAWTKFEKYAKEDSMSDEEIKDFFEEDVCGMLLIESSAL